MANKWVYMFSEGDMTMRNLLGGKGANLAEMTSIGLPVPQGFTITTEACTQYYEDGRKINDEIMAQAMEGVKKMEEINGKKFGDLKNPLLVSVRSGARASMPGMMDTILNLGLNDEVVAAMIAGNPDPAFERFVYDSYRRFIQMFSDVVMEVGKKYFEQLIDKMKEERGVKFDIDLTAADLKELAEQFKAEYKNQLGTDFPSDPVEQLKLAIEAVLCPSSTRSQAIFNAAGAACGKVVFTAEDAETWNARGEKVVLVRLETSPEDITGMKASQGILTVRGGMTSHAAVVARGMGTCCVSGCGDINMDEENKKFTLAGQTFTEGSEISIDGTTGNIYAGIIPTVDASIAGEFGRVMAWADEFRRLKVRTNADTPADAKKARELGAEGIGLCRTEHMFFDPERIAAFREMICSDTVEERETALNKILPYQQGDFEKLYEALEGCPVTIRFLDPPLHEFVPTEEADIEKLAKAKNKSVEEIKAICESLHEFNPMMGHRGCRLAVTYPEIAKMQTKAVIRAAINVKKAHPDWDIEPEIMIPLVCEIKELKFVKKIVVETADAEIAAANADIKYHVGTMIEIPRAALTADEIATEADFFCFGTNDLTQMTFGFSRDDAGKFLNAYYDNKIFENDPFAKLDQTGVGKLMETAIKLGKPVNPNLHVGICGEHGGDPSSVEFCHKIGLDYVSCSPFRVPIARLAAAQAAIAEQAK